MAIYELDGEAPDLPSDGRYWIADQVFVTRKKCRRLRGRARSSVGGEVGRDPARVTLFSTDPFSGTRSSAAQHRSPSTYRRRSFCVAFTSDGRSSQQDLFV